MARADEHDSRTLAAPIIPGRTKYPRPVLKSHHYALQEWKERIAKCRDRTLVPSKFRILTVNIIQVRSHTQSEA